VTTATSTKDLWTRYREYGDQEAREEIILRYAPLVKYVVGRMAIALPATLDNEDILSHGTIGLIEAVERFDPSRGVKFETYAIQRIRGSIIDTLRKLDLVPRSVARKAREIEAAFTELQQRLQREPTDQEMARHLGITLESFKDTLLDASCIVLSLDGIFHYIDDEEPMALGEILEDANSPSPTATIEDAELREALIQAINQLPDRDRLVISLYYNDELTLKEISKILGISESRVCQLHTRAVLSLRSTLQAGAARIVENNQIRAEALAR